MEVPRDHQFRNAVECLQTNVEYPNEYITNTAKTILENSDMLKELDPFTLSRIKVKLSESEAPEKDKVIKLIDRIIGEYTKKIDNQIKSVSNELYIFKVLGALQKSLASDEYLRLYQYRRTWEYDLEVNKNYTRKNLFQIFYVPTYSMYVNPSDIINIFFDLKETLENKISTLITELKKEGVSGDNLEKGLSLLETLYETLLNAMEGATHLQNSSQYKNLHLKLDKLKFGFAKFHENIAAEIDEVRSLNYLAKDEFEESNLLKGAIKDKRELESEIPELEGNSYFDSSLPKTLSEQIHVNKFILNYSRYLSDISESKIQKFELTLDKSTSPDDLNYINEYNILINGNLSPHPASEISSLIDENIDINPVCTQMIGKMISSEMFKSLLDVARAKSSYYDKDIFQITELNRFVEINVDKFDSLEVVVKLMCGYPVDNDNNVEDFILVVRSFKILLSDFKLILHDEDLELTANNFEILDFVSPEVKVENFNYYDTNYKHLLRGLLEKFSPPIKTIPLQYKKILDKEIEMNNDLSLAETLVDQDFISCFENVCILHGTQLNPEAVLILAKSWEDKEFRVIFSDFINSIVDCRKANLKMLDAGLLPTVTLPYNNDLYNIKLYRNYMFFIDNFPEEKVKIMKDFLYFICSLGCQNNSQFIEDWIGLEFRSDNMTSGTVSRAQEFLALAENDNFVQELDDEINLYAEQLKSLNIDMPDKILAIKNKIAELSQIKEYWKEGYIKPKQQPFFLCNLWIPEISSNDDITVLKRFISFRTKEGKKLENTSTLNLVGIIPVNPTLKQREQISVFMKACDSFITQNSEYINKMDSEFEIPSVIVPSLDAMDWLSEGKKTAMFIEMIRFSYDLNYHYIQNWMSLAK